MTRFFLPTFLFSLSFLIRFFFLKISGYHGLGGDEGMYWRLAHQAFEGKVLFTNYMPGWPYILSSMMWLTPSLDAIRLGVIAIASATTVLVYLLGKNVFNERTGFLAGILLALSPEHILSSPYIYAEIILEFFMVLATYITFRSFFPLRRWGQLCLGVFLFGLGLLCKHFVVIPFLTLMATLAVYHRQKIKKLVFLGLIFMAPLVLYSVRIGVKGGDPFFSAYSALHVMNGWVNNRISRGPGRASKIAELKKHLKLRLTAPLSFTVSRVKTGIENFWGLNSYAIGRLQSRRYYRPSFAKKTAVPAIVLFNFLIVLFGMMGLIFSKNNEFKFFSASQLVLLTYMCLFFFLVSRHRLPFMFILILYSSEFLMNIRSLPTYFSKAEVRRWACLACALAIFSIASPLHRIHDVVLKPLRN